MPLADVASPHEWQGHPIGRSQSSLCLCLCLCLCLYICLYLSLSSYLSLCLSLCLSLSNVAVSVSLSLPLSLSPRFSLCLRPSPSVSPPLSARAAAPPRAGNTMKLGGWQRVYLDLQSLEHPASLGLDLHYACARHTSLQCRSCTFRTSYLSNATTSSEQRAHVSRKRELQATAPINTLASSRLSW